jgi:hypothetical protein
METIWTLPAGEAVNQARKLWAGMLEAKTYPTHDQIIVPHAAKISRPAYLPLDKTWITPLVMQ